MENERVDIPKLEGHNCFACGTANPKGLNLYFYRSGDAVCTDVTLDRDHEGWENVVHGGIISTLLDETMSWAIIFFKRTFFVTRKMEVKYVRPVEVEVPLTVAGRIIDDSIPPKIRAVADIRDGKGRLLVRGTAEFVELPQERLSMVPESLKKEMILLFERLSSLSRSRT
jgi:acyl-coenzyme A thioesterase PaaI-like protein